MATERAPFAWRGVGVVLAVQAVVLLAMSPFYGPHRDEMYFVACGRHLAWGYPDQPSFVPLLARMATVVAPDHLTVLRLPAMVAVMVLTALAAAFSRLYGGGRGAQVLTASTVAASVLTLTIGHRISTATFDTLAWTAILLLVTQAILDDRPRLWLWAGVVAGMGLNNKHAVAFLLIGILVACAMDPVTRPVLRTRWPWLAGMIALVMWLPNLVWQAQHGWPVFELSGQIASDNAGIAGRVGFLAQAAIMFSPIVFLVWVAGLVQVLRRHDWRRARLPAHVFLVVLAIFLAAGGKGYYVAGAVVPLIAAGCTWLVDRPAGRVSARRLVASGVVLALSAIVAWPAFDPVLPESTYAGSWVGSIDYDQGETVGWPGYMDQLRAVITAMPASQRRHAVVFTDNYGEAGAAQWYGVGLPVYSGHNAYRLWGPPPASAGPVVVVGLDDPATSFDGCRHVTTLRNRYGLENDEDGADVSLCTGPKDGWAAAWPHLVHYDA